MRFSLQPRLFVAKQAMTTSEYGQKQHENCEEKGKMSI
jgi:hypothetical protein